MKTISVIDTFGYFFRNFYAMPKLTSKDGFPTGVLVGFANLINQLYNDDSSYLVFALEGEGEKVRKIISDTYKANRQEIDPNLLIQINVAIDWIKKMNLSNISIDGYEADDVIASIVSLLKNQDILIKIVSVDKDLYQLIRDNVYIYDPFKKINIGPEECFEKFGVYPSEFVEYQSLVGDSSDNILGISGIGPKSARILINNFKSIDGIYNNLDKLDSFISGKMKSKILAGKDSAYLSRELVVLKNDLINNFNINDTLKPNKHPLFLIEDELKKYNINNILLKIKPSKEDNLSLSKLGLFKSITILNYKDLIDIINNISESSIVAFDTETDSLDVKNANIVGFSFATSLDIGYYVPLNHNYLGIKEQISIQDCKKALKLLFKHHIIGHNIKFDIHIVKHNFDIDITKYSDTMILAWLENSSQKCGLDYQVKKNFNYETIKFEDIVKDGDNFSNIHIDIATKYAVEDVICTLALYNMFIDSLDSKTIDIANNIEFPFINILVNMENSGIGIDKSFFMSLKDNLQNKIENISNTIFNLCECKFNMNSTKQLGYILFDKLKLKKGRVLKSASYSTDERTLESLVGKHPIIPLILEYRELSKLLNTYVIPILNLNKNSRVYTSFLQTGTTTGRLSSKSPNLQNIPVKTELGREIRRGFIAKDGYKFLSADYSQIELRLLAHFSKDPSLLEAFNMDKDIHLETAIRLFGNNDAYKNRNIAKSINFGLIYGMGVKKLSQTLKISNQESKNYIDNYFKSFPTVKEFLSAKEDEIIKLGYSSTILGRKRKFRFDNTPTYEKLAFLREGVNAIFQGSAADLIKLAMNECHNRFKNRNIHLLLQVHDELIFEVKESEIDEVSNEIADIMNNIYPLLVPLKCGLHIGHSWYSLK